MSLRAHLRWGYLLAPLTLVVISCSHKHNVRMPSYWPEARAHKAEAEEAKNVQDETPVLQDGSEMQGLASWYGESYHGKKTASGETYNMNRLTAAHKTLPFDTRVRVTNVQSHKEVVVRINDRGPFVDGRVIDLSKEAAKRLDVVRPGVAPVRLQTVAAHALPQEYSAKYAIQVGYFKDRDNAARLLGRLKRRFSRVSVEPVERVGFRVQVGPVDTRSEAERVMEQLRDQEVSGFIRILE